MKAMISEITEIKKRLCPVNIVAYSGGKDSTTSLQLVLEALKDTSHKVYIITADTLMEIPFYADYVIRNLAAIRAYIEAEGINAEIVTVRPLWDKTFWYCTLGKGYPSSHHAFKWCTQQLKIDPINEATTRLAAGQDHMVFVGLRQAESARRAKTYTEPDFRPNHFAPILYWSTEQVWTYLLTEPCPWGDHKELVKVYKNASDECVYGSQQNVCIGNARYGCWICPLQKNTQLKLLSFTTSDDRYYALKNFKDMFQAMALDWCNRSRIRRNGKPGVGPFLVTVRQDLYKRLKSLEAETGWPLISTEEESLIFDIWTEEAEVHNKPNDDRPRLFNGQELEFIRPHREVQS